MLTVSVVMPAYNVEKYIGEAINSIINQSYSEWELIVVDDCSTDATVSVVESFLQKHKNIRLICRNINSGGCRLPRFDGISAAQGKYICPVDSDDALDEDYLQKIVDRQKETGSDIVLGRMVMCDEYLTPWMNSIPKPCFDMTQLLSGREACMLTIGGWSIAMAGLLCKTDIYQALVHSVYDSGANGVFSDELDHRKLLLCAETIAMVDARYFYRQQPGSIVHSCSAKSFQALIANRDLLLFVKETFGGEKVVLQKMYTEYFDKVYRYQLSYYAHKRDFSKNERRDISRLLKNSFFLVKQNHMSFVSKKQQIMASSQMCFKLFTFAVYAYLKIKGK